LEQLVSPAQYRRWNRYPKSSSGFLIHDQLELLRLLDRKVSAATDEVRSAQLLLGS
jgi:hypothetical protein